MKFTHILRLYLLLTAVNVRAGELDYDSFQTNDATGLNSVSANNFSINKSDLILSDEALGAELVLNESNNQKLPGIKNEMDDDSEDEIDMDEFFQDDFSDLGIDMKEVLKERALPIKVKELPVLPEILEKKVEFSLLQLSCDEFTARISTDALSLCGIRVKDNRNTSLELTMDEHGKIISYSSPLGLTESKKLCLSGYVASKPAKSVGTNFTCRILF